MTEKLAQTGSRVLLEQGDPADDGRAFRRCLGLYPTGVSVITARHGDAQVGMAVNSFAAVSLDPPLVLWSIRKASKSLDGFLKASHFAVNILASDQVEASQLFGSGHPQRFALTPWRIGVCGAPLLEGAIGHLECRTTVVHEGGDHLIVLGHVQRYARFEGDPLVFAQGQYALAQHQPLAALGKPVDVPGAPAAGGGHTTSFLKLLSLTQQHMSALFDEHRRALGVTPASTRVLTCLDESPCEWEALERATYLGREALEDTLSDLQGAGLAWRLPDGRYQLSEPGRAKRAAVAIRSAAFTQEKLRGISPDDIAAAQRVLQALLQS